MLRVYTVNGSMPITEWDGNGHVSFKIGVCPFLNYRNFECVTPYLKGLHSDQIYCLTMLGSELAQYDPNLDEYVWTRLSDEPFQSNTIRLPGSIVRSWEQD